MRIHYVISLLLLGLIASCEHDSYETGDGNYSRLTTDYVTVDVKECRVQSIVTDDDVALDLGKGMTLDIQPKDTMLRWLLYYKGTEIVGRNTMLLLKPLGKSMILETKTDPVTVTSVWMAGNRKYLNMRLGLKVGNANGSKHGVALIKDKEEADVVYYTLYHDQSDIPEYYTQEYFFTVKAPENKEIDLTINTYNGTWHKRF
ncbi:MAG: hypothetical protein IKO28_04550 [Prevotella sp.]|nr:hypothetical protein [Prevotella sp.]MBR4651463.1 hypothetical protein [Prevotella sp.]